MKKIFYVEDNFLQFKTLNSILKDDVVLPNQDQYPKFIRLVQDFLDPIGETENEQAEMKKDSRDQLDLIIGKADVFILDYHLESGASSSRVTGFHFFREYVIKHKKLEKASILFTSSSSDILSELKENPLLEGFNVSFLLKNLSSPTQINKIKKWVSELL